MAEKIRILFLIGSYGNGGKERQLAELIKGLPSERYELHLFIKSDGAHYLSQITEKLVSLRNLDRTRFGRDAFHDILGYIRQTRPHIIHSWADTTSFYASLAKPFTKESYQLIDGSIRMAPPKVKKANVHFFQRMIINLLSDRVVANSKAGLSSFKVPGSKRHHIYNGFDLERIKTLKESDVLKRELGITTEHIVGMVARFDDEKDWNTFFRITGQILEERADVSFIAVGGGRDRAKYQERVIPTYKDRLIFTGERDDVESIVNLFDVGLLISYSEGISNSILEYMALGKPVIVTGTGGIPELVLHEETGYICRTGDAGSVCRYLHLLLDDPGLREKMGEAGKSRVRESFSFAQMISSYESLYQKLCAE